MKEVPKYVVALPFVASIISIVVGQALSIFVARRLQHFFEDQIAQADAAASAPGEALSPKLPLRMHPGPIRQRFEWCFDVAQTFAAVVGPVIAVAFLLSVGFGAFLGLVLLIVASATIVVFVLVLGMEPGAYASKAWPKTGPLRLSLVAMVAIGMNALGLAAAVAAAPDLYTK